MIRMLVSLVCLLLARLSWAGDPWVDLAINQADVVGTLSCASASCHGSQQPRPATGTISQQEYVHWLGGSPRFQGGRRHYDQRAQLEAPSGDPHALAGWRMMQSRFQEVLRRASQGADGAVDAAMAGRCARCHDPMGMRNASDVAASTGSPVHSTEYLVLSTQYSASGSKYSVLRTPERGIGCESCHGGARRWLSLHYEAGVTREQLAELGMIDTKDLLVRARVCAACHVGSSENDMNHDMLAAGHPPLRFELASYEALINNKHWDDRPQRLAAPDYEVQLWAAGRVAAADAALALLASRAIQGGDEKSSGASWPEFSEVNCFACHQALRPPPVRAGVVGEADLNPSSLGWRNWNVAFIESLISPSKFDGEIKLVQQAFERSLAPDAAHVARAALAAQIALRKDARLSVEGLVLQPSGQLACVATLLDSIEGRQHADGWGEMCQQLAALAAARRALGDRAVLVSSDIDRGLSRLAAALRFSPEVLGDPLYFKVADAQRAAMQSELSRIAEALRQLDHDTSRGLLPTEALP